MNKIVTNTLDCCKGQFSKKYSSKKTPTTVNALQLQKRLMHEKKRESKTYKRLESLGEILWYLKKSRLLVEHYSSLGFLRGICRCQDDNDCGDGAGRELISQDHRL